MTSFPSQLGADHVRIDGASRSAALGSVCRWGAARSNACLNISCSEFAHLQEACNSGILGSGLGSLCHERSCNQSRQNQNRTARASPPISSLHSSTARNRYDCHEITTRLVQLRPELHIASCLKIQLKDSAYRHINLP